MIFFYVFGVLYDFGCFDRDVPVPKLLPIRFFIFICTTVPKQILEINRVSILIVDFKSMHGII